MTAFSRSTADRAGTVDRPDGRASAAGRLHAANRYDPELTRTLRSNNRDLLSVLRALFLCLDERRLPGIPERLTALKVRLEGHLLTQDYRLHRYLEQYLSDDDRTAARELRIEISAIDRRILRFLNRWQTRSITPDNVEQFRTELAMISDCLLARIEREESRLHPLYAPLDGAWSRTPAS